MIRWLPDRWFRTFFCPELRQVDVVSNVVGDEAEFYGRPQSCVFVTDPDGGLFDIEVHGVTQRPVEISLPDCGPLGTEVISHGALSGFVIARYDARRSVFFASVDEQMDHRWTRAGGSRVWLSVDGSGALLGLLAGDVHDDPGGVAEGEWVDAALTL